MSKNVSKSVAAVGLFVALAILPFSGATRAEPTTKPSVDRKQLAKSISSAATTGDVTTLADAKEALAGMWSGERLATAITETDAAKRSAALASLADDLAFEPTSEAPTPEGWPTFTPIGEIELKNYPAHRIAVVDPESKLPEGMMFWRLFLHIQKNDIAMTAPVEMSMADGNAQRVESMGFLYQSDKIGQIGTEGNVQVKDVPAQLAVSVGLRGEMNKAAIAEASARIDQWLEAHAVSHAPSGEVRVLGYNSPSMPSEKKFYEVQRLVTLREAKK